MFETIDQTYSRHVVIPDLHGEYELAENAIDRYIDYPDIQFVFLGDVVDRRGISDDPNRGVYRTVELIRELGNRAVMVIANHEWTMLAAISSKSVAHAKAATDLWLGLSAGRSSYESHTVDSYGVIERDSTTPDKFRRAVYDAGHLAVFTNAAPFFETEKFIATHAGVEPMTDWESQKEYLIDTARDMAHGIFFNNPNQWFSMGLAVTTKPVQCTEKVVVSGHAHSLTSGRQRYSRGLPTSAERVLHDGKRVRLANSVNAPTNGDLFIWQDWNGKVIKIERG